jgi:hypothetical protein
MLIKFKKPSGAIVEVNQNSVEAALSLGWKELKDTPKTKGRKSGNSKDSN